MLRWRGAQVTVERNKVAEAAARVEAIRSGIEQRRKSLIAGAASLVNGSIGDALQLWAAWEKRCNREIADLERHGRAAEEALAACLQKLVQANQDKELIAKLRESALSTWQAEMSREVEAFASEAFLRRVTIEKRMGA